MRRPKDEVSIYLQQARKLINGEVDSSRLRRFELPQSEDTSRMMRELQSKTVLKSGRTNFEEDRLSVPPHLESNPMMQSYMKERQILNVSERSTDQSQHRTIHASSIGKLRSEVDKERKEQQQTHKLIAEYLNRFDECRHRQLPIVEINRECFRNRDLRDNEEFVWCVTSRQERIKQAPSSRLEYDLGRHLIDQSTGQYTDEEESEEGNRLLFERNRQLFLETLLTKSQGRFLKIFSSLLLDIIRKQDSISESKLNTPEMRHEIYKVISPQQGKPQPKHIPAQSIFDLASLYQTEYRPVASVTGANFFAPEVISQRVANKRSGNSLTFHPRTFVLSGHQILYYGDSDKDVKKMDVVIPQLLELTTIEKDIGGFFSRTKKPTKMFTIHGNERNLQIEHSELEGAEMYRELCEYFALRAYNAYCCVAELAQSKLQNFIRLVEHHRLDLAHNQLRYQKHKMEGSQLVRFMEIWMKAAELSRQLRQVDLRNSQLPQECLQVILDKLDLENPPLSQLNVSGNHLSIQNLRTYARCLYQMPLLTSLNLSGCGLTDSLFEDVFRDLPSAAEKLVHIDLSHNPLTHLSMPLLLHTLQRVRLAEFVADGLQLGDSSVGQFLNEGIELTALSMNDCKLNLNDVFFLSVVVKLSKNTNIRKLSLRGNPCSVSREALRAVLKDSKSLEALRLDIPQHYFFAEEDPTNEWTVDYLF